MFEKFVNGKISSEYEIAEKLNDLSRESILKSSLSDFTKNFLINDFESIKDEVELKEIISKSNKLYFNYTIRPKWTLLTFLFNNFESRSPNEILKKLNYFPFYKFYSDSIKSYIEENSPIFVTKTDVQKIIDTTNNVILEKLNNEISNLKIKNFFLQIFMLKYEDESRYNLESSVHYSFIKIFLEDKTYKDLGKKFSNVKDLSEDSEINLKDIIKVLTDKFVNLEKSSDEIVLSDEKEAVKPFEIKKEQKENLTKAPKPKEKKQVYSDELVKKAEEIIQKKLPEVVSEENDIKGIPGLFDARHSERILDKIYKSDLIKRQKSFDKLENIKNWTDATKHLKEIFKNNNVDIYNKDVVLFVNILNEYFKRME
jgi:hypothetical protein